jgi:ABC-2 type transport system ATP-binding protein
VPVLQVSNLTKRFGRTVAVRDLTFEVGPGTITGFLGPNGAGKTTTLRVLLGLHAPTAGSARILGRRYADLDQPLGHVGAVLDADGFHRGRSGWAHLRAVATAAGLASARVDEVLDLVGLGAAADRRVKTYSLGMRQRLAIAAALLGDPEVLILDEPGNGLDPEGIRWLRAFLRARAAEGRTVFVSSHQLAEIAQTVDDVVIVDRGRLVAHAPVRELAGITPGVRVRSPEAVRLSDALAAAGHTCERAGADLLTVPGATPEAVGELAARHGIVLYEIAPVGNGVEDAFLRLTGEHPGTARPVAEEVRA